MTEDQTTIYQAAFARHLNTIIKKASHLGTAGAVAGGAAGGTTGFLGGALAGHNIGDLLARLTKNPELGFALREGGEALGMGAGAVGGGIGGEHVGRALGNAMSPKPTLIEQLKHLLKRSNTNEHYHKRAAQASFELLEAPELTKAAVPRWQALAEAGKLGEESLGKILGRGTDQTVEHALFHPPINSTSAGFLSGFGSPQGAFPGTSISQREIRNVKDIRSGLREAGPADPLAGGLGGRGPGGTGPMGPPRMMEERNLGPGMMGGAASAAGATGATGATGGANGGLPGRLGSLWGSAKNWAQQNPAMAGAAGGALGMGTVDTGVDAYQNHRRREEVANMPFSQRLAAAMGLIVNPQGVANRLY